MEKKLCPMKQCKEVTKDYEDSHYRKLDYHIVSFGECDKEKCAWWTWGDKKENGWCAIQSLGNLSTIM